MLPLGPKLAHVRSPGFGARTWDSPRYQIPGVSPSHTAFELAQDNYDQGFHSQTHANVRRVFNENPATDPTITRDARIGSQFSSLAAGRFFQGFANLRFSQNLGGVIARPDHPALNVNFNPNQPGSKEQQRVIPYDPWPAAGVLYPKAI